MADVAQVDKVPTGEENMEAEVAALMAATKKKKKDKKSKKGEKKEKKKEKKDKKKKKKASEDAVAAGSVEETASAGNEGVAGGSTSYSYDLLLDRMYEILKKNNPEYAVKKRYVMAPPQVYRVGSTRTCWANFAVICGQMKRAPDHVLSFFLVRKLLLSIFLLLLSNKMLVA